jgi:hypothetical protein
MIISSSSNSNEIECFDCKVICLCLSSADYAVQTRENANKSLLAKTFIDSLKNSRNWTKFDSIKCYWLLKNCIRIAICLQQFGFTTSWSIFIHSQKIENETNWKWNSKFSLSQIISVDNIIKRKVWIADNWLDGVSSWA